MSMEAWRQETLRRLKAEEPEAYRIALQLAERLDGNPQTVMVRNDHDELLSRVHLILNFMGVAYGAVQYNYGSGAFEVWGI